MKKNQKGVSVVETMVSLGIFSILMLVTGQMLMSTQKMSSVASSQREAREDNKKIDNILSYELRKAAYFYPKTDVSTQTIPQAVLDDTNAIRLTNASKANSPSDFSAFVLITNQDGSKVKTTEIGNVLTFFSIDETLNVKSVELIDKAIKKKLINAITVPSPLISLVKNTTGDTSIYGAYNIIDKMSKDAKVQLLKLNCLFLRKNNETNSVDLVLYQQSGFYNASESFLKDMFSYNVESNDNNLPSSVESIKNLVIGQINYYLNSNNYTSVKIPKNPFQISTVTSLPPSLDFKVGTSTNHLANGSFKIVARNIGIKKGSTNLVYLGNQPTIATDPRTNYKTNIDFSNVTNNSILNSSLGNDDIGFKVRFEERNVINTVKISLDTVKVKNLNSKPIYNHTELNIRPKVSTYTINENTSLP